MPAYAVAHLNDVDTTHPDIAEYLHRIDATLAEFGGRFLVHGQPQTAVEGTGWAIVVEFPDHTAARAWYDSPRYQAIVPLRRAHSSGAVV
ncbi:MAG: DUF1330 domain-containing protein, partial [Nocardia sp.]|nr:DUF1330 domain-containing protein [Nocardia sp.]